MASRMPWSLQCSWALICWGGCPWVLASRIWQRRRVKASEDRKPCFRVINSSGLSSRTIIDLMPVGCQVSPFCQPLSRGFALGLGGRATSVTLPVVASTHSQEGREHGSELHGENELGGGAGSQGLQGIEVLETHGLHIHS